uniref:RNase H type-1 domain-containing protein n=1 Tax=Cannabis sativa TaxID=3483 RepID=A0A803NLV2_CANSA
MKPARVWKGNRGLCLKARDHLCLPKSRGGLDFCKSIELNQAILAKWEWALLTDEQSLYCRVLRAKYLKSKTFMEATYTNSDSWFWKNVVKSKVILRKGACKLVSNGEDTNVWSILGLFMAMSSILDPSLLVLRGWLRIDGTHVPLLQLCLPSLEVLPLGVFPIPDSRGRVWDWVKFLWNLKSNGVDSDKLFLYASIIVDTIWKNRNDKVHNFHPSNIAIAIDSIFHCYTDYVSCLLPSASPVASPAWTPPHEDWVKINCDAKIGGDSMCIAALARNHSRTVVWAAATKLNFRDPLIGEAAACHLALDSARLKNHNYILVDSDSELVIKQ